MLGPPTVLDRNECFERVNFFGLPLPPRELSETATRTTPAERRKHSQAKPRKRSPDRRLHTGNQEKELTCLHSKGIFPSLPPQMETVFAGIRVWFPGFPLRRSPPTTHFAERYDARDRDNEIRD